VPEAGFGTDSLIVSVVSSYDNPTNSKLSDCPFAVALNLKTACPAVVFNL